MFISNLQREAPEFKRCCFCLPLRRGLMAWGYTKLGLNILMMAFTIFSFFLNVSSSLRVDGGPIGIFTFVILCLLGDTAFNIVFIVGGHKKSIKLLKISYVYNMVWLSILTLLACCILYENIYFTYKVWRTHDYHESSHLIIGVLMCTGFASIIFVQLYVILLTRSEMKKLHHQTLEMQFTNHAVLGEPQCTLHNAFEADQCTDKKQAVQDCCTDYKSDESDEAISFN